MAREFTSFRSFLTRFFQQNWKENELTQNKKFSHIFSSTNMQESSRINKKYQKENNMHFLELFVEILKLTVV